jgi:phospholipid/cholesterol/gamma-HCH transport system substrate-binding protein
MAKKAVEFKVGLVVIMGVVMLAATLLWLQGYQYRQSYIKIRVSFQDVGGLKKGDPVSVSGVTMGKVQKVNLTKLSVLATLSIEKESYIYEDAVFTIKNYGMMGERYIYVNPGSSQIPINCSIIHPGQSDPGTSELIGLFGETIRDVQQILSDIKNTIASEANLNNLTDLASSLTELSHRLNKFMGDNEISISKTLKNAEDVSNKLSSLVQTNSEKIDTAMNNFTQASVKLNSLTDSLEIIAGSLSNFLKSIEEGDGTLGLLGADETLYQDVKKMVRSVETIIEDIRRDPKKYLNIEMKIF